MSEQFTEQQKAAIENHGGNLLVSAAAGSGKTRVLVERIVKEIYESDPPRSISDYVIITFTTKAATELRTKIRGAFSNIIANEPRNPHMAKQMSLLYASNISTVHAFCAKLLRANAAAIGISADFRVADERDAATLRQMSLRNVMDNVYANIEKPAYSDIKCAIDQLAAGRNGDEAIPAMLYSAYETIMAHPWPEAWLEESIAMLTAEGVTDAGKTPWGRYLMEQAQGYARTQLRVVEAAQDALDRDAALSQAYGAAISEDLAKIRDIAGAITWDELGDYASRPWKRLGTIKKKDAMGNPVTYDMELQDKVKSMRERYKKAIDSRCKSVISGTSMDVLKDIKLTAPAVRGFFEILRRFTAEYTDYKKSHNVLDFSDLEHKTIEMLWNRETGERTEIGNQISSQFAGVYVDEYQDTNAVQAYIFEGISSGNNLFMVGDVKQSIYGFRLADPSVFLESYDSYASYETAEAGEPRKVLLTKNFRSREEILDCTNEIMRTCMSETVGGVNYTDAEALVPGKEFISDASSPVVEFDVIDMAEDGTDDDEEGKLKCDVESKFVAERVLELLNSKEMIEDDEGNLRPIQPSDICLLLRSTKNSAKYYEKALLDCGISVTTPRSEPLLQTTEISTLFSMLQIIDNPAQDIPLVGVLASPLFGFTGEDLAAIRIAKKGTKNFYEAMLAAKDTMPKVAEFIDLLQELRQDAKTMTLSRLFQRILDRTDALDVYGSMENGQRRMENINFFYEKVVSFGTTSGQNLFRFISSIAEQEQAGTEMQAPTIANAQDAVTVCSIHASKGLEFPVVFMCDTSRRFNVSDLRETVLMHKDLGIGIQITDPVKKIRYPSMARIAIAEKLREEAKSEELRILYVGLTRAQQKLIMCYTETDLNRAVSRLAPLARKRLSVTSSQSVASPGEWILLTALTRDEADGLQAYSDTILSTTPSRIPWDVHVMAAKDIDSKHKTLEEVEAEAEETGAAAEVLAEREPFPAIDDSHLADDLAYVYPFVAATQIPSKRVVTQIAHAKDEDSESIVCRRPNFELSGKRATSAERGTATHKFLCLANYSKLGTEQGIESEIQRLLEGKFIDKNTAESIIRPAVRTFFNTAEGKALASVAPEMMKREFPFSILMDANSIGYEEAAASDKVLVQGVVDLFYMDKDGIHLFDFKTDRAFTAEEETEKTEYYKPQIDLYATALSRIYSDTVVAERALLFLRTGHKVAV